MSRTRLYEYVVRLPGASVAEWDLRMDDLCDAVTKRWTPYYWSCGSATYKPTDGGDPMISYLVVANKSKAKRLAAALDDELNITGELVEWLDD